MPHTKSHGNRSIGTGEKDFEGVLPYIHACVMAMRPWSCDQDITTNVCSPYPWRLHTKFGFKLIGKAVLEEKMFKLVRKMTIIVLHLFGFETKTLVLVASVPGHCLPLTFY